MKLVYIPVAEGRKVIYIFNDRRRKVVLTAKRTARN